MYDVAAQDVISFILIFARILAEYDVYFYKEGLAVINVTIIYPTDPLGVVPGGTDTCIRDIIKCAPDDIRIRLIGVSNDVKTRPLMKWSQCLLAGKYFDFYPVVAVEDLRKQMKVPLSARFTWRLVGNSAWKDSDILQFHRLEPALLFYKKPVHKVTVIHQNMNVLRDKNSDIRWKYFPNAYFWLEDMVLPKFDEIRIVREDAITEYRKRFPALADHIRFLPTWMNPDLFFVSESHVRCEIKRILLSSLGWPEDLILMISVGRLDHQKDPLRSLDVMALLTAKYPLLRYIMVGDGVLRPQVEKLISTLGLSDSVALVGAKPQEEVAGILRCCDLMLLTSAYEGMPRCVVESLGCGVPVASTDVGEVKLLIHPGKNGMISADRSIESIADAVNDCIEHLNQYMGTPCAETVMQFSAMVVLQDLYQCYRRLVNS